MSRYIVANFRKKSKRVKGKSTPLRKLIQSHTGPVFLTMKESRRSRMTNERYVRNLNVHQERFYKWQVPFRVMEQHDAGTLKLKVSPCLHTESGLTLLYLDIDTHDGIGKPEDARRLLMEFRRRHFPSTPEPVITDRGGSAWLVVQVRNSHRQGFFNRPEPEAYNAVVERMQTYLRSLAASMNLDLSGVEVKGKVYVPNRIGKTVVSVKAGDMMKPPPAEEWFTQPAVVWSRFEQPEFEPLEQQQQSLVDTPKLRYEAVSFCPKLVTEEMEKRIPALCQWVEENFTDRPTKANKFALNSRQFAEVLLSMYLLKPNEDGSNPVARYKGFITCLYKAGVFHYGYNHYRLMAVQEYLSLKGCIDWKDNSYSFGTHKACKWKLCDELMEKIGMLLTSEKQQQQSLVDTSSKVDFSKCTGHALRPVLRTKSYASCVCYENEVSWTPEDLPSMAA